nr:hypothetical protein [uncultured Pedobacter sp.]
MYQKTTKYFLYKPDESFTGSKVSTPIRTNIYGSYKIDLSGNNTQNMLLVPSVVYHNQAKATSMSAGMQLKYNGVNAAGYGTALVAIIKPMQ